MGRALWGPAGVPSAYSALPTTSMGVERIVIPWSYIWQNDEMTKLWPSDISHDGCAMQKKWREIGRVMKNVFIVLLTCSQLQTYEY